MFAIDKHGVCPSQTYALRTVNDRDTNDMFCSE